MHHLQFTRSFARHFQARANYRISQGNIDGAIDDKLLMHRLARLIPPKGSSIHNLVGISIEAMAAAIPLGANPEHPLTEKQIRRIIEGLDSLPPRTPFSDILEWERLSMLSVFQEHDFADAHGQPLVLGEDFIALSPLPWRQYNWNIILRRINEGYDAMQEPPPRAKFNAIEERIKTWGKQKWKAVAQGLIPGGVESALADILISMFAPAILGTEEAVHRSVCAENMQRLALAMLLYQCEHGKLPDENWAAGVPAQYLSCPSNSSPEGETTYAMVRYDDTTADTVGGSLDTMLLIELTDSVPIDKAIISVDEVLERKRIGSLHPGTMVVAYRSGAVRFLSDDISDEELLRSLGRAADK
jgi:hypothetical protein